jgi:NAD+ diphosphatase
VTDALLPDFSFQGAAHDRLSHLRDDDELLSKAWSDPDSRVLVARGVELATGSDGRGLAKLSPSEVTAGDRILLGGADGVFYFVALAEDQAQNGFVKGLEFRPLRTLAPSLDERDASLAVHAVALAQWHGRHPCCAVCGARTVIVQAGASRRCPQCSTQHFPRNDPAVIMLVVDDEDRCLLGHNAARDATWYSTLAGFVEPGETLEDAVVREVAEETGVVVDDVTYAGSQPWPFPSSLMLGFLAHASGTAISVDGEEITKARWFTREDLRREVESGVLVIPSTISISGALIQSWYGAPLPRPPSA